MPVLPALLPLLASCAPVVETTHRCTSPPMAEGQSCIAACAADCGD